VKVEAMPADVVLAEIASLTGIRISAPPAVLEMLVTADLSEVEIETALARLLAGWDHVLVFGPASDAGLLTRPVLKEVRRFPAPTRTAAVPTGAKRTDAISIAALIDKLHDPDPTVRAATIEALGRSGPEVPVDRVLAAGLGDDDPPGPAGGPDLRLDRSARGALRCRPARCFSGGESRGPDPAAAQRP
jgi:hypothetical protein